MSTIKVKEIKDDAIIHVPVNKAYYVMVKAVLYDLFTTLQEKGVAEETLKNIMNKEYANLEPTEKSFYTVTLLLAEIERQASLNDLIEEKEVQSNAFVKPEESSDNEDSTGSN
jgi:hypothetical protein